MSFETGTTYCSNHPTVETALRCKSCEKLICPKCARRTPTGYQCRECERGQQKAFETAETIDYVAGWVVAVFASGLASLLFSFLGNIGFFGMIIVAAIAPVAGVSIAELLRSVTRRRRSKTFFIGVLAAMLIGALPILLIQLFTLNIFGLIYQGIYLILVTPTVYYRLSGIQLSK